MTSITKVYYLDFLEHTARYGKLNVCSIKLTKKTSKKIMPMLTEISETVGSTHRARSVVLEHQIIRLQVSMHDALIVKKMDSTHYLPQQ